MVFQCIHTHKIKSAQFWWCNSNINMCSTYMRIIEVIACMAASTLCVCVYVCVCVRVCVCVHMISSCILKVTVLVYVNRYNC